MAERAPIVVAITGASGVIYAIRLLQSLCHGERNVHLTISPSGAAVIKQELGMAVDVRKPSLSSLVGFIPEWTDCDVIRTHAVSAGELANEKIAFHEYDDFMAPIASGSFRTSAMVICPCSGSTLSGVARASASNLVQRAAEVHLKEQRKLILVPRETPVSVLQLENMHQLASAGVVVLPAMPGWYHGVQSLDSLVDFMVARILDQLDFDNGLIARWGE